MNFFLKLTSAISVIFVFCLASAQENMFLDPGFEAIRKGTETPYWWRLVSEGSGSAIPDFKDKHSGQKSLRVSVQENENTLTIRYFSAPFKIQPGTRYLYSLWAKGEGILNLVVQQRVEEINAPPQNARRINALKSPDFQLEKEWKRYDFPITADADPALYSIEPQIVLSGKNAWALLDDAELKAIQGSDQKKLLNEFSACSVVKAGMKAEFIYSPDLLPEGTVLKFGSGLKELNDERKTVFPDGKIAINVPEKTGCYGFSISNLQKGIGRRCYVHVLSDSQYERIKKTAENIQNPGMVLVLGDSLSDYLRDYNWVGVVSYFCREKFPGKSIWYNYAVGGDMAPRILNRLEDVPDTYARERYRGIKEVKPDLIMISLGQNDSLSLDRDLKEQSPTQVPPNQFKECMTKIIARLRKQYPGAKIVLFTPFALCTEKCRKFFFANRKLLFGEPSITKKYVELVQEIGGETGCDVLDVYTPFRMLEDSSSFFLPDGIHLNVAGNLYAAEVVLKYLTQSREGDQKK